nr:DUF3102 domain-containing protein [Heyndrickxia oleronia]
MEQNEIKGGGASAELSKDLNVITAEINAYQRVAGEAIFEIGKRLKHVKENDLVHGEWSKWCETIGMSRGQATKFITVFDELHSRNGSTSNQIGLEALYQIATMPEETREQPHTIPSTGETKTVDEMTVRELREVKKALKTAVQQRDTAIRDAEILRDTLESIEDIEPAVEVQTKYIEVTDERTIAELARYKELFGDVSMYEGKTTRNEGRESKWTKQSNVISTTA